MNQLILGDNLATLRYLNSESVDLIYLDPPFFSNRNYEVVWGDKGEVRSFEDRFSGGIEHYIMWLKERVQEMYRVLKPTGSLFLHCDWHASHYIKVYVLDKIFGYENFRGEITWQRTNAHNDAKKKLAVLKDSIFYYTKNGEYSYKPIYLELSEDYKTNFYRNEDERGVYMSGDLTGPKINPKDPEWHGYHPKKSGRSWAVPNVLIESIAGKEAVKTLSTFEKLELLYDNGYIIFTGNGTPRVKRYLEYSKGILLGDVWTDIKNISAQSKELIGYPTQKPEKLLERIIQMASNESDVVLDPFVGGGTTVAVADRLKRQWIGIDQSVQAVKVTELRLHNQMDLFSQPFMVKLHKYDYDTLRYKDAFEFENFIVQQFGGYTNLKQRNDSGIDGRTKENTPIQVKRSDNIGRNVVDNFYSAIQRFDKGTFEENKKEGKAVGHLIAFSFGRGATQEVARLKMAENIIINLVKIEDIVPIAKKPQVEVKADDLGKNKKGLHEIAFTATAQSDAGIEFFSWDFNYNPDTQLFKAELLLNKTGKCVYAFQAGIHHIAVKVVDNDGLESIAVVKIKINGAMTTD